MKQNNEYVLTLKFSNKTFFDKKYEKIKILVNNFEIQLKNEKDEQKQYQLIEKFDKKKNNYFSMYLIVPWLDKKIKRKKEQQYDVTKIYISTNLEQTMKEYDRKIMNLFFPYMSKEKQKKEIAWLHFGFGFAIDDTLYSNLICLKDHYFKK